MHGHLHLHVGRASSSPACAGQVIRPVLGITMGPPALISRLNIDGVLVYSAPRGGPAGDAGVQGCQRSQFGDLVVGTSFLCAHLQYLF